jgi:hypothetical protein
MLAPRRPPSAIARSERQRAEQSNRIARRRAEEEGGDMLFVPERRRSRRHPKRDPRSERQQAEQSKMYQDDFVALWVGERMIITNRDADHAEVLIMAHFVPTEAGYA